MIPNLNLIRDEAIKRAKCTINSLRSRGFSRKEVRKIALESAKESIRLLSQINNGEEELDDAMVDLLAQKVVLAAMKSF